MKSNIKMNRFIVLIGLFLIISVISVMNNNDFSSKNPDINNNIIDDNNYNHFVSPKISWYNNSEGLIYIDGNAMGVGAYNWTWARNQPWCRKGDGSWGDPYVIENVTINARDSPTGGGIYINNSKDVYFTIQNCTIYDNGVGIDDDSGIKLYNTNNGTLINNTLTGLGAHGICLTNHCYNNSIIENWLNANHRSGIYLKDNCSKNNISGNTANDNYDDGICLFNKCNNNTIIGNILTNFFSSDQFSGISIVSYCEENVIYKNTLNDNYRGIYLNTYCNNNTIKENTATEHTDDGIYLIWYCNNNTLIGNTLNDNLSGIHLRNYSDNNTIIGNTANNNTSGIIFGYSCNNNTSSDNILNNNFHGIYLFEDCDENNISQNIIDDSDSIGIYLRTSCTNNNFIGNNISKSQVYGVFIEDNTCVNNTFYNNSFIENTLHAKDDSDLNDNHWDNGTIGNYWDNYNGADANDNLIGDIPYKNIAGTAGNQDNYPIWDDGPHIIIINLPNPNETFGKEPPSFNLWISFPILNSTWYTLDNDFTNYTFTGMSPTIIQSVWDALGNGAITIRFYVNNTARNISYAEVTIFKFISTQTNNGNTPSSGISGPNTFFIIIISFFAIIYIINLNSKKMHLIER